jgi:hypothetical protein
MSKRATDPSRYSAMNVTLSVSFLFGIAAQYARKCAIGIGVADGALEPLQRRLSAQMNDDVETCPAIARSSRSTTASGSSAVSNAIARVAAAPMSLR